VGKFGEDIDRVFDRLLTPRFLTEPFAPLYPYEAMGGEWMPVLDVVENANEYLVRLEIPGVHRENLDLNLTGQVLKITGKREAATETTNEAFLVKERVYGKFVRTIRLPAPIAENKVTANYENGMLIVHLPKATPAPANKIVIK
jgi:HSP20 family protein